MDGLQQTGLPESQVQEKFTGLFPPHSEGVACSYWYVSGQGGELRVFLLHQHGAC